MSRMVEFHTIFLVFAIGLGLGHRRLGLGLGHHHPGLGLGHHHLGLGLGHLHFALVAVMFALVAEGFFPIFF